jgi:alkylation response protein AidB-like acyl-CoA dehydrogenase
MTIPKKFGGPERPLIDVVLAIEQIAKYCGVTARIVVETNMGALGCVMAYGTEGQQREIARRVLEDGDKPAIGMTEPGAGTDLTALKTTAAERDVGYIVNGTKHWITGGGISRTNLIFARIVDRDGHTRHRRHPGGQGDAGFRSAASRTRWGCPNSRPNSSSPTVVPAGNIVVRDRDGFKSHERLQRPAHRRLAVALGIARALTWRWNTCPGAKHSGASSISRG